MKRNLMPLLGVAFVAAVVATGIFYGLLIPRLRATASAEDGTAVVVAAVAMERGAVVRAEDLKVVERSGAKPAGALTRVEEAAGATVLTPVGVNQALTSAMLTKRGGGGPALAIPAGWRAVSIHPSDSSGVVAMLRSGSRVDVQVIESRPAPQLRRMMEDVEVLGVAGGETARPVVTLLVKPGDADRLSLADAAAQLRLLVRNPNDHAVEPAAAVAP